MIILRHPLPAPCHSSPRAAAFASLATHRKVQHIPQLPDQVFVSPVQIYRLRSLSFIIDRTRTARPTPQTCSFVNPLSRITRFTSPAASESIYFPCSSSLVGISHFSKKGAVRHKTAQFNGCSSLHRYQNNIRSSAVLSFSGHICLHSVVKLLCCVITHLFLTMVDCCRLYNDGQVTSRADRNSMTCKPYCLKTP